MDSGELGAAAHLLGVAHPTGFPAFLLLGKATTLLPLGEVALRLDLLSALAAALTCVLTRRLFVLLNPSAPWLLAVAAALLVATGTTFWSQANVAEVYAPTAAGLVGLTLLALRARATGDSRALFLLALAAGLLTGLHATTRLGALICAAVLLFDPGIRDRLRTHAGIVLTAAIIGLAIQLYLPLASSKDPGVDWGNPERWSALADHLSAARIRLAFSDQIGWQHAAAWTHHLGIYLQGLAEVVSWPGLGLVILGALFLARSSRTAAALLVLLLLSDLLFATMVNPMGLADRQVGLVGQLVAALLATCALASALRWSRTLTSPSAGLIARATSVSVALAAAALCALSALTGLEEKIRAGDFAPGELVDAALHELPADSVLLSTSDDLSAGTLFARLVEGARPDVTHVVRQHVWDRSYLTAAGGSLVTPSMLAGSRPARIARQDAILRALVSRALNLGRSISWEPGRDDSLVAERLRPAGQLYQLLPAPLGHAPALHDILGTASNLTPQSRRYVAGFWDRRARWLSRSPQTLRAALDAARAAVRLAPEHPQYWNNLAVLLARQGALPRAVTAMRQAVRLAPLRVASWANLGLFYLRSGNDQGARAAYDRARELAPHDPRALVGLGILAARSGHYARARRLLREALARGASGDTRADALANLRKLEHR